MHREAAGANCSNVLAMSLMAALALIAGLGPVTGTPAFAAIRPGWIVFASSRGGQSDLWVTQADGSSPVNLTHDMPQDDFPAWSADGSRIAWTKGGLGPEGEIWVMEADGSNAHQVTLNAFADLDATWSPDRSQIAFRSLRGGNCDIYVIDADGKNERRLTTDPASDCAPDWSPDGKRIAWTSARSGHQSVYTMNVDGSDVRRVTPDELEGGIPGWSPEGDRILFSDALCATCAESDLWGVNADGSGLRQITDTPTNELAKSWSRDGKRVVGSFLKQTPPEKYLAKGDLAVWDVATGAMTKLANSSGSEEGRPDWSTGGSTLVLAGGAGDATDGASLSPALSPSDSAAWSRMGGGVASIEYNLPKAGHVHVRVYDAAGREVAHPVNEWQASGHHVAMFAFGAAPNQVFRYRVECDGRRTSGKISTGP
jgi:TolB protein